MKAISIILVSFLTLFATAPNKTVSNVDSKRFAGTWYSLYSIPTMFDKGSRQTTTHYTLNKDGYYDVVTTCIKNDKGDIRTVKSKIFRVDGTTDGQMKAQFIWPIKVDYWVIDLAPDYSWVVVGHPDHRFLFIMSRKPEMDKSLHDELVAKCKAMGYPVENLVSQQFPGAK
ncbi:MAG: lipocalin family protein [Bacteroidota bacterium]|nr:lipocalin family protein [Bacteroidota bacterium]